MKRNYLISYIEDNDLGVYPKQILVEADGFIDCVRAYSKEYPTIYGAKEVFGSIQDEWRQYYSHASQDELQKSKRDMEVNMRCLEGPEKKL